MLPRIALILEDDLECRTLLTELLAEKQLQVKAFSDPGSFLAARLELECQSNCPCVGFMVTDNNMPGMSGLEFFEMLETRGCRLPVSRKAIISGNWSEEECRRARLLGCRIFKKPYKIVEIYAWVDEQSAVEV